MTQEERAWLNEYCRDLTHEFPELVDEVVVFGSKARGDAGPDSDLDVLVIIKEGNWQTKRAVRHVGHLLAITSPAVPSIMVYTHEEWSNREQKGSPFYRSVMHDGIRVA